MTAYDFVDTDKRTCDWCLDKYAHTTNQKYFGVQVFKDAIHRHVKEYYYIILEKMAHKPCLTSMNYTSNRHE